MQKMGSGIFEAWDNFEVDLGQVDYVTEQVERVRSKIRGFTIKMRDIINWKDLQGLHGIATGNPKKLKVEWSWVEFLRFLVIWSYKVVGIKIEDNVSLTWTPGAEDFVEEKKETKKKGKARDDDDDEEDFVQESQPKKKFSVVDKGVKRVKKRVCTDAEKVAGKKNGLKRARKALFKPKQNDFEYGLALSVSEEMERVRNEERREEEQQLQRAVNLSLEHREEIEIENEEQVENLLEPLEDR